MKYYLVRTEHHYIALTHEEIEKHINLNSKSEKLFETLEITKKEYNTIYKDQEKAEEMAKGKNLVTD